MAWHPTVCPSFHLNASPFWTLNWLQFWFLTLDKVHHVPHMLYRKILSQVNHSPAIKYKTVQTCLVLAKWWTLLKVSQSSSLSSTVHTHYAIEEVASHMPYWIMLLETMDTPCIFCLLVSLTGRLQYSRLLSLCWTDAWPANHCTASCCCKQEQCPTSYHYTANWVNQPGTNRNC